MNEELKLALGFVSCLYCRATVTIKGFQKHYRNSKSCYARRKLYPWIIQGYIKGYCFTEGCLHCCTVANGIYIHPGWGKIGHYSDISMIRETHYEVLKQSRGILTAKERVLHCFDPYDSTEYKSKLVLVKMAR